jgi:acetyltransferase-like isoleucine patch superfamily enzyme
MIKLETNSELIIENTSEDNLKKIKINCGSNCKIHIMGIRQINTLLHIYMGDNSILNIGPNQMMNGAVQVFMHEASKIDIGQECLWANSKIWSSDMHAIFDLSSKKRINQSKDITIGNRVWLCENVMVLKGSKVADGCILGAKSVITSSTMMSPNSIVAGNPAKMVKNNIFWDVKLSHKL